MKKISRFYYRNRHVIYGAVGFFAGAYVMRYFVEHCPPDEDESQN